MNRGVQICGYVFGNTDRYCRGLSNVTFLFNNYHCTISKSKLINGTETSFSCAPILNNSVSLVLKGELWVGIKNIGAGRGRWRGEVVMSTST